MGGLMSLYAITAYNKVFSKAACLSPSVRICLPQVKAELKKAKLAPDTRVYLSWGEKRGQRQAPAGPVHRQRLGRYPRVKRQGCRGVPFICR